MYLVARTNGHQKSTRMSTYMQGRLEIAPVLESGQDDGNRVKDYFLRGISQYSVSVFAAAPIVPPYITPTRPKTKQKNKSTTRSKIPNERLTSTYRGTKRGNNSCAKGVSPGPPTYAQSRQNECFTSGFPLGATSIGGRSFCKGDSLKGKRKSAGGFAGGGVP